jgi:hypothetical protein
VALKRGVAVVFSDAVTAGGHTRAMRGLIPGDRNNEPSSGGLSAYARSSAVVRDAIETAVIDPVRYRVR